MPKIGSLGTRTQISTDVGRVETMSLDEAGRGGRALASVGSAITSISGVMATHEANKKRVKKISFGENKAMEIGNKLNGFINQSKMDAKDTNHEDFAKNISEHADMLMADARDAAPDEESAAYLQSTMTQKLNTIKQSAIATESTNGIKFAQTSRQKHIDRASTEFEANPNLEAAFEFIQDADVNTKKYTDANMYSEVGAEEFSYSMRNDIIESNLKGTIRNGMAGISTLPDEKSRKQGVDAMLKGLTPGAQEIMKKANPAMVEKYRTKMYAAVEAQVKIEDAAKSETIIDTLKVVRDNPDMSSTDLKGEIRSNLNLIYSMSDTPKRAKLMREIEITVGTQENMESLTHLGQPDRLKAINAYNSARSSTGSVEGDIKSEAIRKSSLAAAQHQFNLIAKDPKTHTLKVRPDIANSPEALYNYQKNHLKVNTIKMFTPNESKTFADGIMNGKSGEERHAMFTQFMQKYPAKTNAVIIDQLIKEGGLPAEFKIVAMLDDPTSRSRILANQLDNKIVKNYASTHSSSEVADLHSSVETELNDVYEVFKNARESVVYDGLQKAIYAEAARVKGSPGNESDAEAAKTAYKTIIDKNFHVKTLSFGPAMFPKNSNINIADVVSWDEVAKDPEYLEEAGINKEIHTSGQTKEEWFRRQSEEMEWAQNDTGDGRVAKSQRPDGSWFFLRDTHLNKVEVLYKDMGLSNKHIRKVQKERDAETKKKNISARMRRSGWVN